ncbi:hypothetical protein YC2023_092147 [Brassica napus]
MDLIQHSPTVIVCTRPRYRNKEEFRSARFKDSPIVLFGFPGLENDKESPPSDNTHPLVWCHNEENKDKEFSCNFCERQLDSTGYYLCEEFDKRISKNNTVGFHKECIKPMTNNPYHPKHPLQVLVFATVVPNKCAIHKDVWDGKELEGEPEEIFESIMPFEEISDGIIKHFSHKHHMRLLQEVEKTNKINTHCQACAFRIYEGDIYNCLECDFVLHKVCAYLPVKKQHVLHPHPLFLQEENLQTTFGCSACFRVCNNFRYVCQMANCLFTLDVNCAAVSVPLNHQCHPHLLFLPSQPGSERICSICKKTEKIRLECGECDFVFCFRCAILPMKFKYQHDEHPLIFSYEEDSNGQHWCDVCEKEILPKNGIYTCNDCDIQLHIECLHGNNMYLLPCKSVILNEGKYDILCNDLPTRYTCKRCQKRCEDKTVYKRSDDFSSIDSLTASTTSCVFRLMLGQNPTGFAHLSFISPTSLTNSFTIHASCGSSVLTVCSLGGLTHAVTGLLNQALVHVVNDASVSWNGITKSSTRTKPFVPMADISIVRFAKKEPYMVALRSSSQAQRRSTGENHS